MAYKYLNKDGVAYLWEKIKGKFVQKETGKGLSTNDYTTTEKTKLAGIEAKAQVNVLEGIQVAGGTITPTNKIANVPAIQGATASAAGKAGVAPAPATGQQNYYLAGDGTWHGAATTAQMGLMSTDDKSKLNNIAAGAEVNQNAFSTVKVGTTSLAADSKTDTLTITAGDYISLTPNTSSDSFQIGVSIGTATTAKEGLMSASDKQALDALVDGGSIQNLFSTVGVVENGTATTTYGAATSAENLGFEGLNGIGITLVPKSTPDNPWGTTLQIDGSNLQNQNAFSNVKVGSTTVAAETATDTLNLAGSGSVSITANASTDTITISGTNTTYSVATTATNGLMSASDKIKLNGIASGAQVNQNAFGIITIRNGDETSSQITASQEVDGFHLVGSGSVRLIKGNNNNITISSTNTTYSTATTAANGLMSSTDKTYLDKIYNHKIYVVPFAGSTLATVSMNNDSDNRYFVIKGQNGIRTSGSGSSVIIEAAYHPTNATPLMDGTPAAGTSSSYARGDHRHPTDTSRAPLASPIFTGTPGAPTATAGTATTQIATTAFVSTAIANALDDITGISYEVVESLPATGQVGVIYLLANSGTAPNIYDEYIWTGTAFEKIGTTDVDLSGYVQKTDMVAITNAEIDTICV